MQKRTCKTCGQSKAPTEFYRSNKSNCKPCVRRRVRETRAEKIDYYRAYDRARADEPSRVALRKQVAVRRRNDPEIRAFDRERAKAWQEANAEKRAAHIATGNAIRDGKLTPEPCERCGQAVGVQAHHEDYSKPLDVTWLCPPCHGQLHREINEERRAAS